MRRSVRRGTVVGSALRISFANLRIAGPDLHDLDGDGDGPGFEAFNPM